MRLSSYSCFRVALQKSQVMTSFCPPIFFPGGATVVHMELVERLPVGAFGFKAEL